MGKRLYRSRKYKMLGGVAGGMAEYFDIDPVIVRALFIIATFGWGISLLVYLILWIIVPAENYVLKTDEESDEIIGEPLEKNKKNGNMRMLFGAMLIIFGIFMLIGNLVPWISIDNFWPIGLILFGGYILYRTYQNNSMRNGNEIG